MVHNMGVFYVMLLKGEVCKFDFTIRHLNLETVFISLDTTYFKQFVSN